MNYLKLAVGLYHGLYQSQDADVSLLMTATVLGPKKKKGEATHSKRDKENTQSKNHKSFLLNKIMIHHILKITTEQPKKAYFKANYRTTKADLLQS